MRKVRVKFNNGDPGRASNANQIEAPDFFTTDMFTEYPPVNNTLKPVPRDQANVEAEKGETVLTNMQKDGMPEHYVIGGKPHSRGGTPLNLPNNSFVFSKDKKLKIDDPDIL